jgi:hypothetical protein
VAPGPEGRQTVAQRVSAGFRPPMKTSPGGATEPLPVRPPKVTRRQQRLRRTTNPRPLPLRAFASSRAVPFHPAFASREAAKAAKSCRAGRLPLSTPQREIHPVPLAAAKHCARAQAQGRREGSPLPSFLDRDHRNSPPILEAITWILTEVRTDSCTVVHSRDPLEPNGQPSTGI